MSVKQTLVETLTISVVIVFMFCMIFASWRTPGTFQEEMFRIDLALADECPYSPEYLLQQPVEVGAVCADFGVKHAILVRDHPLAADLYHDYGNLPEWLEVADLYGLHAIQVVEKFRQDGSHLFAAQHQLGSAIQSLWQGEAPTWQTELEPIQYGYLAIMAIHKDGHGFLDQFVYDESGAKLRPLTGVLRTVESFLLGGVNDLQDKLVLGQETYYADWGWAAADGAVLFLGGSAVVKGIKGGAKSVVIGGKGAAVTSKLAGLKAVSTKAGGLALKGGTWTAKKAAPFVIAAGALYVSVKHPQAVVATLAAFGLSTPVAIAVFLGAAVFLLWPLITLLLAPVVVVRGFWHLLKWPWRLTKKALT